MASLPADTHQMCMGKYTLLLLRLDRCNNPEKIIRTIEFYYDNCDPTLKAQTMTEISDYNFFELKSLLKILIKEIVNRDMIHYVLNQDDSFPLCMQAYAILKI